MIIDFAKVREGFGKSDALKKRMLAGSVIGEPVRFFYRLVKYY